MSSENKLFMTRHLTVITDGETVCHDKAVYVSGKLISRSVKDGVTVMMMADIDIRPFDRELPGCEYLDNLIVHS